jgi:hypothetical protein
VLGAAAAAAAAAAVAHSKYIYSYKNKQFSMVHPGLACVCKLFVRIPYSGRDFSASKTIIWPMRAGVRAWKESRG